MIELNTAGVDPSAKDQAETRSALTTYLQTIMSSFHASQYESDKVERPHPSLVFEVLTSREFCYLSKTRVLPYQNGIIGIIEKIMRQGEPLRFYYDIGGGYHAAPRLGDGLCFTVGLAELLLLSQIATFSCAIRAFYPPGVRFSLIVDNMCAFLINDIPLESTLRYCHSLNDLIRELQLYKEVDLIVESEHLSLDDFNQELMTAPMTSEISPLTGKQYQNVERFLGRQCDAIEASERTLKYKDVIHASERLLAPLVQGVHMTQRATASTICFRPFPGGDSRIQCGEVALSKNSKQKVHPILLTTSNIKEFSCCRYRFPGLIPSMIPYVTYAEAC